MTNYVIRKISTAMLVIFGVSLLVFLMVNLLPGDAVGVMLAEFGATAQQMEQLRQQLGLDRPLMVRYWEFFSNALRGDFGKSLFTRRPVMQQILEQYPSTAQLALASLAVSVTLGVTWGVIAAVRRNTWVDTFAMMVALLWVSMPGFWLGLLFIYIFSVKLGWFPPAGSTSFKHLVLPALALGMRSSGLLARLTRSSMLEVLRQDYVTTARAKGLAERMVIWRHALKNALIPVITMIGVDFGHLLGGAVIAEIVFARRGIGDMIIKAIIAHDFPLVQGGVFILACAFVMVNSLVDVTYGFLDPRIRYD